MGSDRSWLIIFIVFSSLLSSIAGGSDSHDPEALDALFHFYANQTLAKHRTGILYKIPLPSNFSGMEVSVIRLRSGSLWARGSNSSFIMIPPRVRAFPHVKRLAIVYENLGEWSSKYYQIPGYTLVSPVVGFNVYDSSNATTLSDRKVTLSTTSDPVSIHFPYIEAEDKNVTELKCVKFGAGGSVKFQNMTARNVCVTGKAGHFSVVIPSMPEKKVRIWKWWVIGFVSATAGLVLLILVAVIIFILLRRMKIKTMEKESDNAETLDTFWVRGDKMPSASMTRTQPVLEHDYVP
ncbi:PREDICTED: uncharacterized protein LOC18614035 [Theobroma cacao]|uniref:Uncharacterized protein LOC18614035 n=1 Tax=Theobroma cacao TaxID=3641 RepID=A0AB32VM12_THECC|nr:PREDICTED: uncharacterized protein LOC18614035 [Theobroma cacao]